MDGNRFDSISRAIAIRSNRRQAIRQVGAGGALAAVAGVLGLGRLSAAAQDDDIAADTCTLQFRADTAVGPEKGDLYEGEIELEIGETGAIDNGLLRTKEGDEYELVGQATGRAINLRITLAKDRFLSLTGTAEQDVILCRGAIEGTFGGPRSRDLGTWSATRGTGNTGGQTPVATAQSGKAPSGGGNGGNSGGDNGGDSGGNSGQPTATPTPCPPTDCGDTFVLDPNTCECVCLQPYTRCGDSCCFGGAVCNPDGSCNCPAGTEPCNEVCTPSCAQGESLDPTTCTCGACPPQQCTYSGTTGQVWDPNTCQCVDACTGALPYFCGGTCSDMPMSYCESGGYCVYASTYYSDINNCGSCGTVCPPNMPCIVGTCQCPATMSYVNGKCE
jgi:hypothetical protein